MFGAARSGVGGWASVGLDRIRGEDVAKGGGINQSLCLPAAYRSNVRASDSILWGDPVGGSGCGGREIRSRRKFVLECCGGD